MFSKRAWTGWNYSYEGAMLHYLQRWMDQLRWQRLRPFEKLADMLLNHLEGIFNYCRTKVRLGMVVSDQWKHQVPLTPRPWVYESPVLLAQSATDGRRQNRVCGVQERGLKCASCRIPTQSPISNYKKAVGEPAGLAQLMVGYQEESYFDALMRMVDPAVATANSAPADTRDSLIARRIVEPAVQLPVGKQV